MLDLRRVRVFFEVAERRSFSAAAAALDYTQPSVSHHVLALERELGQRLINRGTRPLSLTEAGMVLYGAAAVAVAEFSRAELELRALKDGESGRVALGSVVTGLRTVVPPAVSAFGHRFPKVELVLEEAQPTEVLAWVRSGRLDVGIVVVTEGADPPDRAVFASHLLLEQPMLLAVCEDHRLARRRWVRLASLRGERWLLPGPTRFPEFRLEIEQLLAAAGVVPEGVLESTDDIAAARLIAAGVAVGLAPGIAGMPAPGVVLVPLRPAVTRRLFAVTVDGVQAQPVRALLEDLRSAAALQAGGIAPALTPA
jgi:DNA-binding transcriptional LysR family regulator